MTIVAADTGSRLSYSAAATARRAPRGVGATLRGVFCSRARKEEAAASLTPASARATAPLQSVVAAYHAGHPGRLAADLAQRPALDRYLELRDGQVSFKQERLTSLQFDELRAELKKAGHGRRSHLLAELKQAWQGARAGALPTLPDTRPVEGDAGASVVVTRSTSYPEDKNPFAVTPGANPFEEDGGAPDTPVPTIVARAASYPEALNPFAVDEVPAPALADAPADGLSSVLLQLLNSYLRSENGKSFGAVNPRHVEKMRRDIAASADIARFVALGGAKGQETLTWKREPASQEEVQRLLQALKARHAADGSLFRLLSSFAFVDAGYRLLDDAANDTIIRDAARPALHRPGKEPVVEMKRQVMTEALQHFSDPVRHGQPLPETTLAPLLAHYGRLERVQAAAQRDAEKQAEKHALTLNDQGLFEAVKRLFLRVKTDQRLERFDADVESAARKFHDKMVDRLQRVKERHAPEQVAQRAKASLDQHLGDAHRGYAGRMGGKNPYPARLESASPVALQIDRAARQNYLAAVRGVANRYEQAFVASLGKAVASFSAVDYFRGKSRERAVDNAIKLNEGLASLYRVAEDQHEANLGALKALGVAEVESWEVDGAFQELLGQLAGGIRDKSVANCQDVLRLYGKELADLKRPPSGSFSAELKSARQLAALSRDLAADVGKIRAQRTPSWLGLDGETLGREVKPVTAPLLREMRARLPEAKTVGQTLKSAFVRAFKPTPARILGSIPLVGGLTFALAALPTAIAVPLGIAAAVTLPVALLGWVGWNLYKRFDQRSELHQLRAQMEQHWKQVEAGEGGV